MNVSGSAEYDVPKKTTRGVSESKMWKDFNSHFAKKNRDRGVKVNHHDFLELPNLSSSANGRFSMGRLGAFGKHDTSSFISSDTLGTNMNHPQTISPADLIFAGPNERLQNKLRVFNSMKQHSKELPFNPKNEVLQSLKDKYKDATFDVPIYQARPQPINMSSLAHEISRAKYNTSRDIKKKGTETYMPRCEFPEHQVFIVMDGQDIMGKHLNFWYFEIAHFVAKLIPQRVWDNKTEKLNLYERLMLAAPAIVLQKQMMKEFLAELSLKVGQEILSLYTVTGKRIRTVISIPMYSKVLICSTEKSLKGLKNLDKVQAIADTKPDRETIMKGHEADEE